MSIETKDLMSFIENNAVWIAQSFGVVFITLLLDFIQRRILDKLAKRLEGTPNPWDDSLLTAIRSPLRLFIWVMGISIAIETITFQTKSTAFWFLDPVRNLSVIIILTWFLIRLISESEKNIIAHRQAAGQSVDITTLDAITKLLRLSVMITAGLVTLQTMGFSVSGVLAFGGVGGIAVGFAARDLLANFFGGLMIYLDRPFSVGNWIRSPDRNIEGTVEKIGWRLTVIRTFDKRPLYVPNAIFATIAVENPSRMKNRRIYETIGIRYGDVAKMEAILNDVEKMLVEHTEIDNTQTLMVNFNAFAASSLDFFIYTFTKTTDWQKFHKVKQDVLLKVFNIIDGYGAKVAFPTSTVHIPDQLKISNVEAGH